MKPKDGDISNATPYLGIPEHRENMSKSAKDKERVAIDVWGHYVKDSLFFLSRIEEVDMILNDAGEVIGLYCFTKSKHYFQAGVEELEEGLDSKDALDAYLQHNSVFDALKKKHFIDWRARTLLRRRKEGDEVDHKRKEAFKRVIDNWKKLDKDLRGYLRNMDEDQLLSVNDAIEELRMTLEIQVK